MLDRTAKESIKFSKLAAKSLLFLYVLNFTIFPPLSRSKGMSLRYNPSLLRTGDIIFRRGRSLVSQIVISADARSPYSHVGMIEMIDGKPFVLHVTTDDPPGSKNVARIESLDSFLSDDRALSAAIYRLKTSDALIALKAIEHARAFVDAQVPFDEELDLDTPDRLYCTEMVWRAYLEAGLDLVEGRFDHLQIPLGKSYYLLPSTLLESRWLENICYINSTK